MAQTTDHKYMNRLLTHLKDSFTLEKNDEMTPQKRFQQRYPSYWWPGSESEANSRRTTPAASRRTSVQLQQPKY